MSASSKFTLVRDPDTITVEVLEDGTIKTSTDSISNASHANAEGFLKELFRLAGGATEMRYKRPIPLTESNDHHHHH